MIVRRGDYMSDKIYLGSKIPDGYKYAQFNNAYITLYNQPSAQGETITYYRIYFPYSYDLVSTGSASFNQYTRTYFEEVETSRSFFDRPDAYKMTTIIFIIILFGLFLFNIFTSMFRKGGVLGGLI